MAALKTKVDHFKDERDEFEVKYRSAADRLKKLETLETDRNLLERVEKLRDLTNMEDNQQWLNVCKIKKLVKKNWKKNRNLRRIEFLIHFWSIQKNFKHNLEF